MIQIPEPPDVGACGACAKPLRWYWSATSEAWRAFVPDDRRMPVLHECKPLQDAATWKQLPHGKPPVAEYLEARAALKSKSASTEGEETR